MTEPHDVLAARRSSDAEVEVIARALVGVATAGGAELSVMDRRGLARAYPVVFDRPAPPDETVSTLTPVSLDDLAAAVASPDLRLLTVRLAAVTCFVDGIVEQPKLDAVLALAEALDVHPAFVEALTHMAADDVHWAGTDMIRHNVESIPGLVFDPADPVSVFLPYRDGKAQPELVTRYDALAELADGTLGNAFFHHYHDNHFAFPGAEWGVAEAWGTPHDTLHLLSGYSTSAQGELLVAVFNGASLSQPADPFESHVLPVILTYHLGIELNKGINKGDRERMDRDPSWRDNFEGNVHLGLDPGKLWVAWERGRAMSEDVFSGRWSFWDHIHTPLDELRARYTIPPLDPADAALEDDQIDPTLLARPGKVVPTLSTTAVAERPTS